MREQGFACVHLALGKTIDPGLMDPAAATPGLAAQVKRDLGDLDLAVLGCYLNLTHPDEAAYRDTLRRYFAHIRLARWMNAGCVGTETGNPNAQYRYDPAASHTQEALELVVMMFSDEQQCTYTTDGMPVALRWPSSRCTPTSCTMAGPPARCWTPSAPKT